MSGEPLTTAVEPAAALLARPQAWDDLVRRAREPNPHFSPRVVAAHLASGLAPSDLKVLRVVAGDRLVALLPFQVTGGFVAGGRAAAPFASPYVTSATPLVAGGPDFAAALAALAEGLAAASGGAPWRWPLLPLDGPVGAALVAALEARGWRAATVAAFPRAILERREDLAALQSARPDRDRVRDLARRRRRLEALGPVALASAVEGPALGEAVEHFLAIEARGWKGGRGTAMASRPATAALARALFAATAGPAGDDPVRPRADLLTVAGRPVAASLALVAGGTATLLKAAYDEDYRRFAPGLLLEEAIVRALHETRFADRLNSASRPGCVLESLYPDRQRIADLVLAPPATGRAPAADALALARRARWRRAAGESAREAVEGLRALARRAPGPRLG